MWIWACELHRLGFRRKSDRYWQCERRYGLPVGAYLSLFPEAIDSDRQGARVRIDMSSFHVTTRLGADRIHFYYHEIEDAIWEPGGHTSASEIAYHGADVAVMCRWADTIAAEWVAAFGGQMRGRE